MNYKKLWIALGLVMAISFAVLGGVGVKILHNAPPVPSRVATSDGRVLFDGETIRDGQNVWQSIGGQEIGTVWGHGSYVAPDWSADWLHRESMYILDRWARDSGATAYATLGVEGQAALRARLQGLIRTNTWDATSGQITIDPIRADAFAELSRHYADIFGNGRSDYAIPAGAMSDPVKQRQMSAFFLVDFVGHVYQPARRRRELHPELAARTPGGERAHRAAPLCGAWPASSCCWPPWAAWSGISLHSRTGASRNCCR